MPRKDTESIFEYRRRQKKEYLTELLIQAEKLSTDKATDILIEILREIINDR